MRTWTAAVVVVLAGVGCGKKKEEQQRTNNPPAPREVTPPKEEAPPPPKKEAPPPAETPKVDCAAFVTPADIEKACGGAKVELTAHATEGSNPMFTCNRLVNAAGKKGMIANIKVMAHPGASGAAGYAKLIKDATPISGIGDAAWSKEKEQAALKMTNYDVGFTKGVFVVELSESKDSMNPKPPCTVAQLTELAKVLVTRLP